MNANIKVLPHEPKKPVTVAREHPDVLVIEGVKFAGDMFRTLAFPGPDYLYAFRRDGDTVILTTVHNVEEAEAYFTEVSHGI